MGDLSMKKQYFYLIVLLVILCVGIGGSYLIRTHTSKIKTDPVHEIITNKHSASDIFNAFRMYFWKIYPHTWMKGVEPTAAQKKEQRKVFGYNLRIEHIIDTDEHEIINKKRPTVFIHV